MAQLLPEESSLGTVVSRESESEAVVIEVDADMVCQCRCIQ
jgi:hypothetical protein